MIYLICFLVVLVMLLYLIGYGRSIGIWTVVLTSSIAIGNGGYYALATSSNLQEALLANKIAYVIGVFAPITIFFSICNLCRITISKRVSTVLFSIQTLIYLSVCTMGTKYTFFYRDAIFHEGSAGAYLEKSYGPMHTVYLLALLGYTAAGLVVSLYFVNKRTIVSRINIDMFIFVDILSVGVYLIERLLHLNIELMPVSFTLSIGLMLIPLTKLSVYSVNNINIFADELEKTAYILFSKKLKYMGSNEKAEEYFPELKNWELEEKIPGSGGRFNTFLRQPLNEFVKEGNLEKINGKPYKYKDQICTYEIGILRKASKKNCGYYIKISDVTDVINENAMAEQ